MLPAVQLPCSVEGDRLVPRFLGEHDHPWLRALLEEHERYVGRPKRELAERLREPLPVASPAGKRRLAIHVLEQLTRGEHCAAVPPRRARSAIFGEAARTPDDPWGALSRAAAGLGVAPAALRESLFADLPGERIVAPSPHPISPLELALRANLVLAQGLLFRAASVRIEVQGNVRALARHGALRGLICTVTGGDEASGAALDLSGPFALFRRTLVYGRALGEIVPLLAWCRRFRLRADCTLGERRATVELASGDPIFPAAEPRRYDSRLEERFAREFRKAAPDWDLVREPEAVRADGCLVFPDFALQHRVDPSRRWLLEIAGFWTPEYVARKLARYRAARLANLILCLDEARNCAEADLPPDARVIRFHRRVDPAAVLEVIEGPRA